MLQYDLPSEISFSTQVYVNHLKNPEVNENIPYENASMTI